MKKIVLVLALASFISLAPLYATPQAATSAPLAVEQVIDLGIVELDPRSGKAAPEKAPGDIIWDNSISLSTFFPISVGEEYLDVGDLPDGTPISQFQFGFATDASGPVTVRITFYTGNGFGTAGAPFTTNDNGIASYDVTVSVPGGGTFGYTVTVPLPTGDQFTITGEDLDMDGATDWMYGFALLDQGNGTVLGPSIAAEGIFGAPGREDFFDVYGPPPILEGGVYDSSLFFGGAPFAQYLMVLTEGSPLATAIPTASEYGLMALILALAGAALFLIKRR